MFDVHNTLSVDLALQGVYVSKSPYESQTNYNNATATIFGAIVAKAGGIVCSGPKEVQNGYVPPIWTALDQESIIIHGVNASFPQGESLKVLGVGSTAILVFKPINPPADGLRLLLVNATTSTVDWSQTETTRKPEISMQFSQGSEPSNYAEIHANPYTKTCTFGPNSMFQTIYSDYFCNDDLVVDPYAVVCPSVAPFQQQNLNLCQFNRTGATVTYGATTNYLSQQYGDTPKASLRLEEEVRFTGNAVSGWVPVATGGAQTTTLSTSWSKSSSSSSNTTKSSAFQAHAHEMLVFKAGPWKSTTDLDTSYKHEIVTSTSNTMSQSDSGTTTIACQPSPCDGQLYQWKVSATDNSGQKSTVQSCDFQCVPWIVNQPPACPTGMCSTPSCQCCTVAFGSAGNATVDSRLAGGQCTPPDLPAVA